MQNFSKPSQQTGALQQQKKQKHADDERSWAVARGIKSAQASEGEA